MANAFTNASETIGNQSSQTGALVSPYPPRQSNCDALVLNARSRQALTAIRSLGKRGLHLAAQETLDSSSTPAFSSRWCHHKLISPNQQETKEYLLHLDQLLAATEARVVIPTSDSNVALLRHYREHLEPRARLAIAGEPALAIAVNKEQTLQVAKQLGLRIPRGVTLANVSEVEAALREIGLPAVVKPEESWLEHGQHSIRVSCQLVTTPDEARRAVEELTRLGGKVLFQQFLTGKQEAVSFIFAQGQICARFAQWAKRMNPPLGGVSALRQSIAIPIDIGEQAERLIREIELEGYSEVEFRRDSTGHPYLMEINPRLSASVEIAVRAGVDFPYLLYQWASGERVKLVENYRHGLWMRNLGGDISTTIASVLQRGRPGVSSPARSILGFCSTCFVPMSYDYLDWKDPLPAWTAIRGFPRALSELQRARKASQSTKRPEQVSNQAS